MWPLVLILRPPGPEEGLDTESVVCVALSTLAPLPGSRCWLPFVSTQAARAPLPEQHPDLGKFP